MAIAKVFLKEFGFEEIFVKVIKKSKSLISNLFKAVLSQKLRPVRFFIRCFFTIDFLRSISSCFYQDQ